MNEQLLQSIRAAEKRAAEASQALAVVTDRYKQAQAAFVASIDAAIQVLGRRVTSDSVLAELDREIAKTEAKADSLIVETEAAAAELNKILNESELSE